MAKAKSSKMKMAKKPVAAKKANNKKTAVKKAANKAAVNKAAAKKVAAKSKVAVKNKSAAKSKTAVKSKPIAKSKTAVKSKPIAKSKVAAKAKSAVKSKTVAKKVQSKTANKSIVKINGNWDKIVTPLDDRIFILNEERAEKTPGGLFIPDSVAGHENNQGTVVVAGRGHLDKKGKIHPLDVKAGDRVLYPKYSGNKILINGSELLVLRESDVLGVVE